MAIKTYFEVFSIRTKTKIWGGFEYGYASLLVNSNDDYRLEQTTIDEDASVFKTKSVSLMAKTWTFDASEVGRMLNGFDGFALPSRTIQALMDAGFYIGVYNYDDDETVFTAVLNPAPEDSLEDPIFLRDGQSVAIFGEGIARLVL